MREVRDDDKEFWRDLITNNLKTFLRLSLDLAGKARGQELNRAERLELLADLITFFFKAPLTLDPILSLAPSPHRLYFYLRLMGKTHEAILRHPIPDNQILSSIKVLEESLEKEGKNPLTFLYGGHVREAVRRAWLIFPADTRPGANTASLVAHLLVTSSIAWSLAYRSRRYESGELAMIRLASQLHDIAKPLEPIEHFRERVYGSLIDSLFEGLLEEHELTQLKSTVSSHHQDRTSSLHRADTLSASIDRVRELVRKALSEEFNSPEVREIVRSIASNQTDPFELAYGGGKEAWTFWVELEKRLCGKSKELSLKFLEWLDAQSEYKVERLAIDELSYFLIDVKGVQSFVYRSHKLTAVAAASLLIDYLTALVIPLYTQLYVKKKAGGVWLPLESFLLTSGANVAGILPKNLLDDFRGALKSLDDFLSDYRLGFNTAFTQFQNFYPHMWEEIGREMAIVKISPGIGVENDVEEGFNPAQLCRLCFKQEGIRELRTLGPVCVTCDRLQDFGRTLGFGSKWESGFLLERKIVPQHVWGCEYGDEGDVSSVASNVMELISGMEPPFDGRELNVGVIKGDGNRMGEFFSRSISISDALERSFRLDQSLRIGYEKAIKAILSAYGEDDIKAKRDACRVWLGTLYMGGDDFLIISPSWLSLPLAYIIAKEFENNMGGRCTLSIGIASVPAKHSVWHAIKAADELMDDAKESIGRRELKSAVSFDVVERGPLTGETALTRLKRQTDLGLSAKPYVLHDSSQLALADLLSVLGYNLQRYDPADIMRVATLHRPRGGDTQEKVRLRRVCEAVRDILSSVAPMIGGWDESKRRVALLLSQLYCYREAIDKSRDEEIRAAFRDITTLASKRVWRSSVESLPLLDLYFCAKILGGGEL
ncbi:MAG: hypothetical protein RMJ28_02790 [Nitrososphaerota archaeon]|nr:hypothetical protein [Candidatus Calditenuaceae archaeon]MDW8073147.1 hypothetical protein [Nitrososphaerota archaeon]